MAFSQKQQSFIDQMAPLAQQWQAESGIPANVLLAIMASESNYGAAPSLFGMKGTGSAGSQNLATQEVVNGQRQDTNDQFAAYNSPNDAFNAFMSLISTAPRYADAWNNYVQTGDWQGLLQGINKAGYATDPNWGKFIANFSKQFPAQPAAQTGKPAATPQQTGSKPVATTQQDAASQQQFGKNYDQLSPVQKYAIDAQGNIGTNGQPATLYSADDVIKAGGKLSSSGNTYEIKTGGRGSATIYFYPTTDANGKPTGQLQAPVIYANGSQNPVPYTGTMPAGLKPIQGGGAPAAGSTPPAGNPAANQGISAGNAPASGGTPSGGGANPNASASRGGSAPAYPQTTPTFAGVGGGAGAVLDALSRTGGPMSFLPGGGPSPNNGGPNSLANPEEIGRLSGLLVGPGGLDANYLRSQQDTGRDYFGYPNLGMVFGPNGWQFPNQFTQTQNQPPAGGGGGGGGSAPGGDVAQSSVPSGGATLANGNQAGGGGGGGGVGVKAADVAGTGLGAGRDLAGTIGDFARSGLLDQVLDKVGDQFTQAPGTIKDVGSSILNSRINAPLGIGNINPFAKAVPSVGFSGSDSGGGGGGGNGFTASAEVDHGQAPPSMGASALGTASQGPVPNQGFASASASGQGGLGKGVIVDTPAGPRVLPAGGNNVMEAHDAGPRTLATPGGYQGGPLDENNPLAIKRPGQFTNTDNLNQGDQANQQQTMNLFGTQGFANGGEVQAGQPIGTPNPVGIFDLLTGRQIAIAGEPGAGQETVKVIPQKMKKGGKVTAGTPNTTYPSSQWSTGPSGQPEPFFAAGGAEFGVGNDIPQAGVGFSGPKQTTGYESLSYYSRPNTGLNPYPVPMEGPSPPRSSGGGLSGTGNLLSSLLGGGSSAPKLPSYVGNAGSVNGAPAYIDLRTGKTYTNEREIPSFINGQLIAGMPGVKRTEGGNIYMADGGEFTVGSEDPSQSVFNTGYPNAGMSMHPDNTGLLRAMSSLMPVNGSQTQSDVDKSITSMMASLGMGPSQALGNSKLKASLTDKLGLSPRAGAAMGVLTGAAA